MSFTLQIDAIDDGGMAYTFEGQSDAVGFPPGYAQDTATALIDGSKDRLVALAIALQGVGVPVAGKSLIYDPADPNGNILRLV